MTQDLLVHRTKEKTQITTMQDLALAVELLPTMALIDKKSRAQVLVLMKRFQTTTMTMTLILEEAWLKW